MRALTFSASGRCYSVACRCIHNFSSLFTIHKYNGTKYIILSLTSHAPPNKAARLSVLFAPSTIGRIMHTLFYDQMPPTRLLVLPSSNHPPSQLIFNHGRTCFCCLGLIVCVLISRHLYSELLIPQLLLKFRLLNELSKPKKSRPNL
jgi:hypothetical protein